MSLLMHKSLIGCGESVVILNTRICLVFIVLAVLKPGDFATNFYIHVITIIGQLITRHQSSLHWQTIVYYGHLLGSVLDLPITNLLPFFILLHVKR